MAGGRLGGATTLKESRARAEEKANMICVTRLDGREIWVAAEQILTVERTPDTLLTLATGGRLLVKEPVETVVERVVAYRRRVHQRPEAQVSAEGA